jgi:GMP synthase-like glutamine amidotransferase
MDVLAVVHGERAKSELFGEVVRSQGHRLDEWSLAWATPLPLPLDSYDAVLVFGGAMHADQDDRHPWLREENFFLQRLLDLGTPTLGICLGVQLLAKAAHSWVGPAAEPEIGWVDVELTDAGMEDSLLGLLPPRFAAFQWHSYTYGTPAGAEELAQSASCTQAFRLGERVWGVQFHPEVTESQIEHWVVEGGDEIDGPAMLEETRLRIAEWNELGRTLCEGFCELAERAAAAA